MRYGEKCAQSEGWDQYCGTPEPQPQRTFDNIASAVERVTQYRSQVERMLDRITPRDAKAGYDDGPSTATATRPSYARSLEALQDALGYLGKTIDELEGHI